MRILITADLHYDVKRSQKPTRDVAKKICAAGGDALVLLGDSAGADWDALTQCLGLFDGFSGKKLLVAGNHELWCRPDETEPNASRRRYFEILPAVASEMGFEVLDFQPVVLGDVGLVGGLGWYDYSLRDEPLGVPLAFYRNKISPGAARYYGETELLEAHADVLTERHFSIGARWMDGWRVRLGCSDEAFLDEQLAQLEAHLEAINGKVKRIAAMVHHLPTDKLLPVGRPDRFVFAAAFLGSRRIGELLERYEKVRDVYCAHSHWPMHRRSGRMRLVNVGSTYIKKRMEVLEL